MFTLAELREYLNVSVSEISDTALTALQKRVIEILEKQTANYYGVEKNATVIVPGLYGNRVWLLNHFNSITTLRVRLRGADEFSWETLGVSAYRLQHSRLLERLDGLAWGYEYELEVTGKIGYGTTVAPGPFPELVKQVVLGVMGFLLDKRGQEGHLSMASPSTTVRFAPNLDNVPFYTELMESEYNLARPPV